MDERQKFLSTIRDQYGRLCYTHRTHEKEREGLNCQVKCIKWTNVVLTFFTMLSIVAGIKCIDTWIIWSSVILSSLAFAFQVYTLSFNYEKETSDHRNAAKALLRLREGYLILITRTMAGEDLQKIIIDHSALSNELCQVYSTAPDTSHEAYLKAKHSLKQEEELTFSGEEIDNLLPPQLRLGNKS